MCLQHPEKSGCCAWEHTGLTLFATRMHWTRRGSRVFWYIFFSISRQVSPVPSNLGHTVSLNRSLGFCSLQCTLIQWNSGKLSTRILSMLADTDYLTSTYRLLGPGKRLYYKESYNPWVVSTIEMIAKPHRNAQRTLRSKTWCLFSCYLHHALCPCPHPTTPPPMLSRQLMVPPASWSPKLTLAWSHSPLHQSPHPNCC